jgi:hypothetical protein
MREREEQREKGTNCGSTQTIRDEGWVGTITLWIIWTPSLPTDQLMDYSKEECHSQNKMPVDHTHSPDPIFWHYHRQINNEITYSLWPINQDIKW